LSYVESTCLIAVLNRPTAAWNFFFLPFARAERSFFTSLTIPFTIVFFIFGLGGLGFRASESFLRRSRDLGSAMDHFRSEIVDARVDVAISEGGDIRPAGSLVSGEDDALPPYTARLRKLFIFLLF